MLREQVLCTEVLNSYYLNFFFQFGDVDSMCGDLEQLEVDSSLHSRTAGVPDNMIPEKATDVYKNYRFHHKYVELPVLEAHENVSLHESSRMYLKLAVVVHFLNLITFLYINVYYHFSILLD